MLKPTILFAVGAIFGFGSVVPTSPALAVALLVVAAICAGVGFAALEGHLDRAERLREARRHRRGRRGYVR